jgi:hypothetical protein
MPNDRREMRRISDGESVGVWMVPEARFELARLAAEDFESTASTVPPLGPSGVPFSRPFRRRQSQLCCGKRVAFGNVTGLEPGQKPAGALF